MTYASKAPFDAGHRAGLREANVARVLGATIRSPETSACSQAEASLWLHEDDPNPTCGA